MLSHYDLRKNYSNGDRYSGDATENNVKDGRGTYFWASTGATYNGQWKKDSMHGRGEWTMPAAAGRPGFKYTGAFDKGEPHGHGQCVYLDGRTYDGAWNIGRRHGRGKMECCPESFDDFRHYEGSWADDQRSGCGACEYKDGSLYTGDWEADRRHGIGVLIAPGRGLWYAGPFLADDMTAATGCVVAQHEPNRPDVIEALYAGGLSKGVRHGSGWFVSSLAQGVASSAVRLFSTRLVNGRTVTVAESAKSERFESYRGEFLYGKRKGNGRWYLVDPAAVTKDSADADVCPSGGLAMIGVASSAQAHLGQLAKVYDPAHAHTSKFAGERATGIVAQYVGEWNADGWAGAGTMHCRSGYLFISRSAPSPETWSVVKYHGGFTGCRFDGDGVAYFAHGGRFEGAFRMGSASGHAKGVDVPLTFPCWIGTATRPLLPGDEGDVTDDSTSLTESSLAANGSRPADEMRLDYSGHVSDGAYHGEGEASLFLQHGSVKWSYSGAWKLGVPCGDGAFTMQSIGRRGATTVFQGECEGGLPQGKGTMTVDDGPIRAQYTGAFRNGQRSGHGRFVLNRSGMGGTYEAISHYNGEWLNDLHHGQGNYQDAATSDSYTGEWVAGKRHGAANCVAIEYGKSHYCGAFSGDMKHGRGVLKFSDGRKYEGDFASDEFHGQGTLTLADGATKYAGNFAEGQCHGHAEATFADGRRYKGNFIRGDVQGQGELWYTNGDRYKGTVARGGDRRGAGTMYFSGGGELQAHWNSEGQLDGEAFFTPPVRPDGPSKSRRVYRDGVLELEEALGDDGPILSAASPLQHHSPGFAAPRPTGPPEHRRKACGAPEVADGRRKDSTPRTDTAPDGLAATTGGDDLGHSSAVPLSLRRFASAPALLRPANASGPASPSRYQDAQASAAFAAADFASPAPGTEPREVLERRMDSTVATMAVVEDQIGAADDEDTRRQLRRKLALLRATKLRCQQKLDALSG
jgi:hypothetical protein